MPMHFILHGAIDGAGSSATSMLFGAPVLAAVVAGVLAIGLVYIAGWRAGFAVAAAGALFLGCGLIGDVASHNEQSHHRHEILHGLMQNPTATAAHELMELDSAEARNVWHVTSAAGQGLLVAGLAGAALILWRQRREYVAWEEETHVPVRQAA